jgi:uncharacterized damage-inducible protein DinB
MMKKYFEILFNYNKKANSAVSNILDKMADADRKKDRRAFVQSLHGLLDHIAEGEIYFQKQLQSHFRESKALQHDFIAVETQYNKINFREWPELKEAIMVLDQAFLSLIKEMEEQEIDKIISVDSFEGKKDTSIGLFLLQAQNHATHHRGQISQILDELGIQNDYSGIG